MAKRRPKAAYLHQLWSKAIRERDDYRCQACGRLFRDNPGVLHASHHIARGMGGGSPYTKYDMRNGAALCAVPGGISDKIGCHQHLDTHPLEHADWIKAFLSEEDWEALKELDRTSNDLPKWRDAEYRELSQRLKDIHKDYRARRMAGETGRLL